MLMSWLFWGVVVLVVVALASRVPGIDLMMKPVGMLLSDLIKWFGATVGGYLVFLVKSFFGAHLVLLRHLLNREDYFDVELRVKNEVKD